MSNNAYKFKAKVKPELYKNGPVRHFTKEEIEDWSKTSGAKEGLARAYANAITPVADQVFLDDLARQQLELGFRDIMEGPSGA